MAPANPDIVICDALGSVVLVINVTVMRLGTPSFVFEGPICFRSNPAMSSGALLPGPLVTAAVMINAKELALR
jgi:hypothetical protein